MTWTATEIEEIVMHRPLLAVALLQILVQRTIDFTHRIESFSVDNIARRPVRSLIRFSERLGTTGEDGSIARGAVSRTNCFRSTWERRGRLSRTT